MMVFLKHKLVFLATPKTASTSIEIAYQNQCDIKFSGDAKHTSFRKYQRLVEPFVMTLTKDEPDTVAIIRDPLDWLGSWYRYRSRSDISDKQKSSAHVSFDTFVEGYLSEAPPQYAKVGSQFKFMSDKNGDLGVSHVFRYEEFDQFSDFLQKRTRKSGQIKHLNRSPSMELTLSPTLKKELHIKLEKDFELHERLKPSSFST